MNTLCRRSARLWQEDGERPTKYFYQCIKQLAKKHTNENFLEMANAMQILPVSPAYPDHSAR